MTFPEFESRCQQWFYKNESRFLLSDLRVWRTVPGAMTDNDVWYCLVNIRRGVNMIMLYDHSGDLEVPFEVMVDWARNSLNIISSKMSGYTTNIGEYTTMAAALADMTEEPSPYLLSPLNDAFGIGRVLNDEEKRLNQGTMIDLERLSFLECLEKLQKWRDDPNNEWKGRVMTIFRHDSMSEVIYETQM